MSSNVFVQVSKPRKTTKKQSVPYNFIQKTTDFAKAMKNVVRFVIFLNVYKLTSIKLILQLININAI